jgi:small neutral amino acid transporter SnatA (MarC family)
MASVMLLGSQEPDRMADWSLALFLAWLATAVILLSATRLYKVLGQPFLIAVERLMGMLLVAISVQMLMDGIAASLRAPALAA